VASQLLYYFFQAPISVHGPRRPEMRDRIFITKVDFDRLCRLVTGRESMNSPDSEYLERLEQELDRAEIVDEDTVPHGVVTMNSEVRLKDLDSGDVKVYKLVFPHQTRSPKDISILAPIGTAILGYRVGDAIEWPVPKGIRRLEILQVLRQPVASGTPS
jgi:regulator of nucleoside diphosphate kinase